MIVKVVPTGNNAKGLLKYLMDKTKSYRVCGGNIIGTSYSEIIAQWQSISSLNPRTDKDTKHISLSLHQSDRKGKEKWLEIAEFMVRGLGYDNNLWIAIEHAPTPEQLAKYPDAQPHLHLMIHTFECASGKFKRVNDWQDKTRAEKLAREIEERWELHKVVPSKEAEYAAPSMGQVRRFVKETQAFDRGEIDRVRPIIKTQLQSICTSVMDEADSWEDYLDRLERSGVSTKIATIENKPVGISYGIEDIFFAGSKLAKKLNWKQLQEKGWQYDLDSIALKSHLRTIDKNAKEGRQSLSIESQTQIDKQIDNSIDDRYKYYRIKYKNLYRETIKDPNFVGIETDIAVAATATLQAIPLNEILEIIKRGDRVQQWHELLSKSEYQQKTEKHLNFIAEFCLKLERAIETRSKQRELEL
jgi:Rps23 Pro-64 3,4-dihydroxylase Tpa1-like proline 4-hydroxylase